MTQEEIKELYDTNEKFRRYVDRFVRCKSITADQALSYRVVMDVAENMVEGKNNI
ncbi:MAG: hypothetical protein PUB19_04285 [Lachnospiraceae bacterium]|nr:hypothetical protein [Lachnospiraceae bacterium]